MEKIKLIEKDELVPIYNPDKISELSTFEIAVTHDPADFNTELLGCISDAGKINFAFRLNSHDDDDDDDDIVDALTIAERHFSDVAELIMTSRRENTGVIGKGWSDLYNIKTIYNSARQGHGVAPIMYEVSNKTILALMPGQYTYQDIDSADASLSTMPAIRFAPTIITTDINLISIITNNRNRGFFREDRNTFDSYALFGDNISFRRDTIKGNNDVLNKYVIDYLNYMFFLNHMVK